MSRGHPGEAPWAVVGEAMVALVPRGTRRSGRPGLPPGIKALPGPALLAATRWTSSPVGAFVELVVAVPARMGLRPGLCVVESAVNHGDALAEGRLAWGFPRELGTLRWSSDGFERRVEWEERGLVVRAEASRGVLPFLVPLRAVQHRADGRVVVPGRVWGLARAGRVAVIGPPDHAWLCGIHRGLVVSGMHLRARPARHPHGWVSTLLAPLPPASPEPA